MNLTPDEAILLKLIYSRLQGGPLGEFDPETFRAEFPNFDASLHLLVERNLVRPLTLRFYRLTSAGIDHARWLVRPRCVKMWDFMKGDVRSIIVAAITAIVVAVVTTLALRVLGWG